MTEFDTYQGASTISLKTLATAKLAPTFADREGCHVVSATDPHGRIVGFLDQSHYYFYQGPIPDPLHVVNVNKICHFNLILS
jgi:hypothetical protein